MLKSSSSSIIVLAPRSQKWPGDNLEITAAPERLQGIISDPVMAEEPRRPDLTASSATIPSDSENYSSSPNELSPSPPSSSSSPMILYSPPTIWGLLRGAAINILLPFVNGLMLGFGELFAHEAAFRLGWSGTKVTFCFHLDIRTADWQLEWLVSIRPFLLHSSSLVLC